MAAPLSVYIEADDVKARLAAMGLTHEPLAHAARRWYLSWISFTANHPPFGIGIAAWMEAVAALRETSILFAALISMVLLREKVTWNRIAAAMLLTAGAVAIRLS